MKIKFQAILAIDAMAAVTNNGDALRYLLNEKLFVKIAAVLKIDIG
jgi:hypothetical protein